MKDTVQELVDALDGMTTSILERIRNTWILIIEAQAGDEGYFSNNIHNPKQALFQINSQLRGEIFLRFIKFFYEHVCGQIDSNRRLPVRGYAVPQHLDKIRNPHLLQKECPRLV